jgi:predicted lactoylglutathione lyase
MEQRVSLITLGVRDVERARSFYESLGWTTQAEPGADIVFFQAGGMIVALWDRSKLAEDTGLAADGDGFDGIVLAQVLRSQEDVDRVVASASEAGARVTDAPAETFWGGYSGKFVDPDGHAWEIAWNPSWTLRDDGSVSLGA